MKKLKKLKNLIFIGLFIFFLLSSCSSTSSSVKDNVSGSVDLTELDFFDSFSFDSKLSSSLKHQPNRVTARFLCPVTINKIPERMDKWLFMVEKFGGEIQLEPEGIQSKGFISELISLAVGTYNLVKEKITYEPVKSYNARIFYDAESGRINRIIFEQKNKD